MVIIKFSARKFWTTKMKKAFLMRDGWPDPDNNRQATHQNRSKNDDTNNASEKTDQIDALLNDIDDSINKVSRDFLRKIHSTTCTVQNVKHSKSRKKDDDRSFSDRIKCDPKRRHNAYEGCDEDDDAFAEGTDTDTYTRSSLRNSSSSSGISINTPDEYR